METLRIGLNATCIHSTSSGLGVVTAQISRAFLNLLDENLSIYTHSHQLKKLDPSRIKLVSRLVSPDLKTLGHFNRLIWCQFGLPARLRKDRVQILYSTVEEGILWGRFPQVITCHDILPLLYPEMYPRKKYAFRHILPIQLNAASVVICDSENSRKDLRDWFGLQEKEVRVVPIGLDHTNYEPKIEPLIKEKYGLEKYLLYVGEFRPYKNLERALEAFSRLNLHDYKFVFAGKKDDLFYPVLREKVVNLNLQDRVVFTGYFPSEDLPYLYSSASLFVFPSLYEGFGMPPLEAMACGCPVVCSNAASLPEVCGEAAIYVDPYNIDSIATGIAHLLNDSILWERMKRVGLERAKRFSWDRTARQVINILYETMDKLSTK